MELITTCVNSTAEEINKYLKGSRRTNYKKLVNKIKVDLPELYEELALDYPNPWQFQCKETKDNYILVHSAIEYIISKD